MILFIDTHDELITIALKNNENLYIKTQESEYSHSVYTMPMIEEIFKENNLNIKELKKIIVVNGPGSFTGIRIGLSIAKTMAYALNLKINTISSLTAYLLSNETNDSKKAVIEDNKGYYISVYDKECGIERMWNADPKVWNRHSPLLFPFVGRVVGNVYRHEGVEYEMKTQHGFARDQGDTDLGVI